MSKYPGGNQAAGDHGEGQRSAGWTVLKKIYIEQESQDTASRQRVLLQEIAVDGSQWKELVAPSMAGPAL